MNSIKVWIAMALLVVCAAALRPAPAYGQDHQTLEKARRLVEEARPWFKKAGNTELDHTGRKKARREANKLLVEARRLYNEYLDANPDQEEAMDAEYCEMASMMYWIRKMAGIHDFDERHDDEEEEEEPDHGGGASSPSGKEPDSGSDPKPPAGGSDDTGQAPTQPAPEADNPAVRAAKAYAEIVDYQKKFPGDVPALHAKCVEFLQEFDDPSLPEYTKVAMLAGSLSDRMTDIFKDQTGEDPDAIKGVDDKKILQVIARLGKRLRSGDEEDRAQAARLLGETRSGQASFKLVKAMRDKDLHVRKVAMDSLVAIGGTRTSFNLVKTYRDSKAKGAQEDAVDVLKRIAGKSEVDAKAVSVPLGRFVLSNNQTAAGDALDFLITLGPNAGPGLCEALVTKLPKKKMEVIDAIATVKYYPGATNLARYLLKGDNPHVVRDRDAARRALKRMGVCTIPYLIPMLKSGRHKAWTALVLRDITGIPIGMHGAKKARSWYEQNKPDGGCD